MSDTTFVDGTTPVVSTWLQDVNNAVYRKQFTNVATINGGPIAGMRNRFINGDMSIMQRPSPVNLSAASAALTLDRWYGIYATGVSAAISQQTVTGPFGTSNSLSFNASGGNITNPSIYQRIASIDSADLAGQTITVSGWVYAGGSGTFTPFINVSYANSPDNFGSVSLVSSVAGSTINAVTWSYVTATVTLPSAATTGLQIQLGLTGTLISGNTAYFTLLQCEQGTTASAFERRFHGFELAQCQRYFYQFTTNNGIFAPGWWVSTTQGFIIVPFPVTMRAAPISTVSGSFQLYIISSGQAVTSFGASVTNTQSATLVINVASGGIAGQGTGLTSNGTASLIFNAEL